MSSGNLPIFLISNCWSLFPWWLVPLNNCSRRWDTMSCKHFICSLTLVSADYAHDSTFFSLELLFFLVVEVVLVYRLLVLHLAFGMQFFFHLYVCFLFRYETMICLLYYLIVNYPIKNLHRWKSMYPQGKVWRGYAFLLIPNGVWNLEIMSSLIWWRGNFALIPICSGTRARIRLLSIQVATYSVLVLTSSVFFF